MHLVVDGTGIIPTRKILTQLLITLAEELGMQRVGDPQIYDEDPTNPGISGIQMVEESHISIHTYKETGEINVDVFSCKDFSFEEITVLLKGDLQLTTTSIQVLRRPRFPLGTR